MLIKYLSLVDIIKSSEIHPKNSENMQEGETKEFLKYKFIKMLSVKNTAHSAEIDLKIDEERLNKNSCKISFYFVPKEMKRDGLIESIDNGTSYRVISSVNLLKLIYEDPSTDKKFPAGTGNNFFVRMKSILNKEDKRYNMVVIFQLDNFKVRLKNNPDKYSAEIKKFFGEISQEDLIRGYDLVMRFLDPNNTSVDFFCAQSLFLRIHLS